LTSIWFRVPTQTANGFTSVIFKVRDLLRASLS
jgi:hypothetical protein